MNVLQGRSTAKTRPRRPSPARERFEQLYRTIRDRICLFDYPPGGRLSEEELAEEFSVSRTPVRRVLARLEADGLIEARHGVGNFVTSVQVDELTQLYQLRMELAVLMGRLSPLDGIGPKEIRLDRLIKRALDGAVREVVLATNFTNEGEATAHYIGELLAARGLKVTRLARGVLPGAVGLDPVDVRVIARARPRRHRRRRRVQRVCRGRGGARRPVGRAPADPPAADGASFPPLGPGMGTRGPGLGTGRCGRLICAPAGGLP